MTTITALNRKYCYNSLNCKVQNYTYITFNLSKLSFFQYYLLNLQLDLHKDGQFVFYHAGLSFSLHAFMYSREDRTV